MERQVVTIIKRMVGGCTSVKERRQSRVFESSRDNTQYARLIFKKYSTFALFLGTSFGGFEIRDISVDATYDELTAALENLPV
eukprot:scaffold104358_cov105-Cyclotella_meneghiniana.AAC.2